MRSHETVVGGKVDDDSGVPRPIQDRCDRTVEGTVDETAGIQVPLVLELLEDRHEQIFGDSFTDLHLYPLFLFYVSKNGPIPGLPSGLVVGGSCDNEEWIELDSGWSGSKTLGKDFLVLGG